ncbi:MAG: PEPxxWA-CTERM sorting domain-containing protein, partial [Sphingomicrobium sp.]
GGFTSFLCIESDTCTTAPQGADTINMGAYGGNQMLQSGIQSIASIASVDGAVPEPATWAMMLLGFGAIGMSMRRRRRSQNLPQVA